MPTAYQHRPLSTILAQPAGEKAEAQTSEQPRDEHGRFVAAEEPKDTPALPEKYRGKSVEQVVEMHQNSEKRLGQLQNEVGQLRGLVQDLAQVQRAAPPATDVVKDVDLSSDELISDPVGAIKKVVQSVQAPTTEPEPAADPLDSLDLHNETQALFQDYPDMEVILSDPAFSEYVNRTPSRLADQSLAADPDAGVDAVRAARRLLEGYKDIQSLTSAASQPDPVAAARKVANESGHERAVIPKDVIYETDVIALIQSDPDKYRSPSFQAELTSAIREGRFIKQN